MTTQGKVFKCRLRGQTTQLLTQLNVFTPTWNEQNIVLLMSVLCSLPLVGDHTKSCELRRAAQRAMSFEAAQLKPFTPKAAAASPQLAICSLVAQ